MAKSFWKHAKDISYIVCILLLTACITSCSTFSEVSFGLTPKKIYFKSEGVELSGGHPAGGKYSGPGVKNGHFYPRETKPKKKTARTYQVPITYTVGFFSKTEYITVFGYRYQAPSKACQKCGGTRKIPCTVCHNGLERQYTRCSNCNGNGYIPQTCPVPQCNRGKLSKTWYRWYSKTCKRCSGKGYIEERCSVCHGQKSFPCCETGMIDCPECTLNE